MMNRKLFVANWKMNKTTAEVEVFLDALTQQAIPDDRDIVIAASFPLLPALVAGIQQHALRMIPAAQNLFSEDHGPYTGEVSGVQLRDIGCQAVIVGHSERRRLWNESDEMLNKKLHAALRVGLLPVFAVGESDDERTAGKAKEVVSAQIATGFAGLDDQAKSRIVIAYEPVWAIGTGKNATPEQAEEMLAHVRTHVPNGTRLLYGGSVNAENAAALIRQPSIDGFLIGGASLSPEEFYRILTA